MRTRSLLSLLLVLAITGCDSAPAVTPPEIAPVLPLAVGAEWTLAQTMTVSYDSGGVIRDTTLGGPGGPFTLSVTRDTLVAGETWFRIEASPGLLHCVFSDSAWFANREDGLYRWQTTPEAAERVYATGVAEGVPFLTTDIVAAVLVDDDATAVLPSGPVPVRQYERTWQRLEVNRSIQGPIDPRPTTRDALSPTLGPVALQVSYVRAVSDGFEPLALVQFEVAPAETGASARRAPEVDGAYPAR